VSQGALINWKEECEAIQSEMDQLLTAGWPETAEERQVRKIHFMALIERRNVSAQNFLNSDGTTARFSINQHKPLEIPALPNVKPTTEVENLNVKISREPSEAAHAIDRSAQALEFDVMANGGLQGKGSAGSFWEQTHALTSHQLKIRAPTK
jgi:hypothetical protein